jgi:hypothetical protein
MSRLFSSAKVTFAEAQTGLDLGFLDLYPGGHIFRSFHRQMRADFFHEVVRLVQNEKTDL